MDESQLIEEILVAWEVSFETGRELSIEELCKTAPYLITRIKRDISALKRFSHATSDTSVPRIPNEVAAETRFKPKGLHDQGGLGEIWRASDETFGRTVALKRIRADRSHDQEAEALFRREALITARLEHPGIVPIYGMAANENGEPCYVMRLVQGTTLKHAIEEYHQNRSDWKLRELLQRFIAVCKTIAYAHSKDIIHRDIKPQNIMLGEFGETLVLDWGLAKSLDQTENPARPSELRQRSIRTEFEQRNDASVLGVHQSAQANEQQELKCANFDAPNLRQETAITHTDDPQATKSVRPAGYETITFDYDMKTDQSRDFAFHSSADGRIRGTPSYMAPEQLEGRSGEIGKKTDIYQLGATLKSLLYGPMSHRLASSRLRIAPALVSIWRKATAVLPKDRFDSALTLSTELERWLANERVECHREHFGNLILRLARKHKAFSASLFSLILLMGIAGPIVATSQFALRKTADANAALAKQQRDVALSRLKTIRSHMRVGVDMLKSIDLFARASVASLN